jgi:excisionase family DNA binding protein
VRSNRAPLRASSLREAADPADADKVDVGISVAEAKRQIGCSGTSVRRLLSAGDLRGHRVGVGKKRRGVRISQASVDEYKLANRISPDAERAEEPRQRSRTMTAQHREAVADLLKDGLL